MGSQQAQVAFLHSAINAIDVHVQYQSYRKAVDFAEWYRDFVLDLSAYCPRYFLCAVRY